jgi:TldD protein
METAYDMGEELTGNAIAVGWQHTPIVRMSNIFIQPGSTTYDELLELVGTGLYICDPKGGSTMGDEFAFGAQYGYEIKNGKIDRPIKGINLSGNLFVTMKNILGIGDDLEFEEGGGCGKDGQTNPQSGTGGPHTVIDRVIIG